MVTDDDNIRGGSAHVAPALNSSPEEQNRLQESHPRQVPPARECGRCGHLIPAKSRRRRYCSDKCLRDAARANARAWKKRWRKERGHWPHPPTRYWSADKLRLKQREYN